MAFRPERWLGDPEFKDDRLGALEPFSTGPRNCEYLPSCHCFSFSLLVCVKEEEGVDC